MQSAAQQKTALWLNSHHDQLCSKWGSKVWFTVIRSTSIYCGTTLLQHILLYLSKMFWFLPSSRSYPRVPDFSRATAWFHGWQSVSVKTEIFQLLDGLPWNLAQILMVARGMIMTWLLIEFQQHVQFFHSSSGISQHFQCEGLGQN